MTKKITIAETLQNVGESLLLLAEAMSNKNTEATEAAISTKKKETRGRPRKNKDVETKNSTKVFTSVNPPNTAADIAIWQKQWDELGEKGFQNTYLSGQIDSLGNPLQTNEPIQDDLFDQKENLDDLFGPDPQVVSSVTMDEVRAKLRELAQKGHKATAIGLLEKHGAKGIQDLAPEHYQEVHDYCVEMLG